MLQSLHVKNLALIKETEVEFTEGLNILTGETGAGKSLLIGSINLALGGKFEREMLRTGADSALVELTFSCDGPKVREKLEQLELEPSEEDTIIISRKLSAGKSVCRINGETVSARQVKELAETLIDIHGQHEHQSLLNRRKHMEILDSYCGADYETAAEEVRRECGICAGLRRTLREETMDEEARAREQSLAEYEAREIEEAALRPGEDEELERKYRLMTNGKRILEGLSESRQLTGSDARDGAGESIGRALRAMRGVSVFDPRLRELEEQLEEIDSLLADYNRDVAEYMADCEFDEKDFETAERRLNLLNHLKGKYGNTLEKILAYGQEKRSFLEKLEDYDAYLEKKREELKEAEARLEAACKKLSEIRKKNGSVLERKLKDALLQLNFSTVEFEIAIRRAPDISTAGWDDVEFLISTNPGEPLKSLSQVASGGELSRVMLAIKTVLAGRDEIDTLIFDEIDAGISGRTAWRVSEQLNTVSQAHQVICITHLPQIAAMADHHLCIEKSSSGDNTITNIRSLDAEEGLGELARLLGSETATEAALSNAREMRALALAQKER